VEYDLSGTTSTLPDVESGVDDNTQTSPPDQAAFRVDIPEWLSKLTDKKRRIMKDLMQGDGTMEAATKHGVSPGRVSQIRQEAYDDLAEYVEGRRR
jgi:DNA-directed RNA polymerase specialized sigma subunit